MNHGQGQIWFDVQGHIHEQKECKEPKRAQHDCCACVKRQIDGDRRKRQGHESPKIDQLQPVLVGYLVKKLLLEVGQLRFRYISEETHCSLRACDWHN